MMNSITKSHYTLYTLHYKALDSHGVASTTSAPQLRPGAEASRVCWSSNPRPRQRRWTAEAPHGRVAQRMPWMVDGSHGVVQVVG